ncbi:Zeaxanthin epoxidase chloroplastic, partial [Bienertia sinuspersici]
MSINASGMVLEREAENEVQPMIETDNHLRSRSIEGQQKKLTSMHALWKNALLLSSIVTGNPLDLRERIVPTHDQIWEYVLEKFMIPPEGRSWVLETVNLSWRGYKSKLKKMYLEAVEKGSNLDELYELVPEDELKDLISYWNTSPAKEQSKKNKRNREKLDDMHTMGPKDPNKQEPSKAKVYRESRIRNPKKTYKTSYGNTKANM